MCLENVIKNAYKRYLQKYDFLFDMNYIEYFFTSQNQEIKIINP